MLQSIWLLTIFFVLAWWTQIIERQSKVIVELETKLGYSAERIAEDWQRMNRMLLWEFGACSVFLILLSVFFFWLVRKDLKRNGAVQAFFASVSHELRTPLTSIRLQAESIADKFSAKNPDPLIERLLTDVTRLQTQIDRTLELARLQNGGALHLQSLSLRPFLSDLIAQLEEDFSHQVKISLQFANVDIDSVHADRRALELVMKNLIENSIKHSGQTPVQVTIHVGDAGSDRLFIECYDNGVKRTIHLNQIGDPFVRGNQSSGAGVGLFLVKTLIERMSGRVNFSFQNQAGGFCTLLTLPKEVV